MLRAFALYPNLDDSSGYFSDFVHELSAWYCESLTRAGPEHQLKGELLFTLKLQDDWGFFTLDDFGSLLSKAEFVVYRKQVRARWELLPAAKTRRTDYGAYTKKDMDAYRITRLMEECARFDDDPETLVAIKRRKLESPWDYLQLAETLHKAGRSAEALRVAEDGFARFRERMDSRLVAFMLKAYRKRKAEDKVHDLAWRYFAQDSSQEAYQMLKRVSGKRSDWHAIRSRALTHPGLDTALAPKAKHNSNFPLMQILLDEGDIDAALRATKQRGVSQDQLLRLAKTCEKERAAEAIALYRRVLPCIVDQKTAAAYAQAAGLALTLRRLMHAQDQNAEFTQWLAELCAAHKAKRNFLQQLASRGLLSAR